MNILLLIFKRCNKIYYSKIYYSFLIEFVFGAYKFANKQKIYLKLLTFENLIFIYCINPFAMQSIKITLSIMFVSNVLIFEIDTFPEKSPKSVELFVGDLLQIYTSVDGDKRCKLSSKIKLIAKLCVRNSLEAAKIVQLVLSKETKNSEFVYLSVETKLHKEFLTGRLYPFGSSKNLSTLCIALQIVGINGDRKMEEFKVGEYESFDWIDRLILLEVRMIGRKGNQ